MGTVTYDINCVKWTTAIVSANKSVSEVSESIRWWMLASVLRVVRSEWNSDSEAMRSDILPDQSDADLCPAVGSLAV